MARESTPHPGEGRLTAEQAFGHTMRGIRRKLGLSQQELADKSGYHRTYVGLLEAGQKSPSLRTIFNIAITLRVTPAEMVRAAERLLQREAGTPRRTASPPSEPGRGEKT